MVYIYKKNIGNKAYYYLRASKKKGNKTMVKDIAYLGTSISDVKIALESLPRYSDSIRKAYKTINNFLESNRYLEKARLSKLKKDDFLDKEKFLEVEACKLHFNSIFNKKDQLTKKEILKNFIIEFSFNTTSIEGNTINLNEAKNLLIEGLTPKNKTLREIYDLQNAEKVFLNLLQTREEISHILIQNIHKQLMQNIDSRMGYRTADIKVLRSNFEATPAPFVKTDMGLLLKWYEQNKNKLHPLILASIFHHKFEKIHPFMDGNGRTGRILLNYILLKNKLPPVIIKTKEREEYLKALRIADKDGLTEVCKEHYSKLINFISDQLIKSYWNIFL
ncbi:Fic family protein [Candidatus Woesearchaeota archaeon]|nr:Fic family protein [Candidatus Woesearchaeota archaeon]